MPTIRIPTPLRVYTAGMAEIPVQGGTVGDVMIHLVTLYPALKPHIFSSDTDLRPFVNLFLNDENVRDQQGMATPLQSTDRLLLIPSIAGGL